MGVSQSGSKLTFTVVRRLAALVVVVFLALVYLYGPAATPAVHQAAIAECNDYAQGNWRSYQLSWEVGLQPHWRCADASRPTKDAVSLGWWTNPFS